MDLMDMINRMDRTNGVSRRDFLRTADGCVSKTDWPMPIESLVSYGGASV